MSTMLWANSGDSHFIEPADLWSKELPKSLSDLVPRSVKDEDGLWETVYVDGQSFRRRLPKPQQIEFGKLGSRAPGFSDFSKRIPDQDAEGVWAELVFPSLGMWAASFKTRELLKETARVTNDFSASEIIALNPRLLPTAQVSTLDVNDAIEEMQRCAGLGFKSVFLTVSPHPMQLDWQHEYWEPLWAAMEEAKMVIAFHIGTEPIDMAAGEVIGVTYRGPGGAVMNYTETTFSGQRAVMKMVASGALDRHPDLKVMVSEGGATWAPFLADRMEEGYRQHNMAVRPQLTRSPREIIYSQVYASFQHDPTAVAAVQYMGYNNAMWGSDYPHLEGTYGHTQKTLHELFDGVPQNVSERIRFGAFEELFPSAPKAPAEIRN